MDRIQRRFDKLATEAERIAAGESGDGPDKVNFDVWSNLAESTIYRVFSEDHPYYANWKETERIGQPARQARERRAIVLAAKSDFEDGFLFDFRRLVHADVFGDELEQAGHFLAKGYKVPAAVIAGTVLESTLREACRQHGVTVSDGATLNPMNDELARAGVYSKTRAQQIRGWAAVRNDAAHGKPESFDDAQVRDMISGVRDFVVNQMD